MKVTLNCSSLTQAKPHELVVRFILGGTITAVTGVIAKEWGPVIGGLFLAFPAIFPASITLVERHAIRRKHKFGLRGERRGRYAAGADAAGAVAGSIGLIIFGFIVYRFTRFLNPWLVLSVATVVWFGLSALAWWLWKNFKRPVWHR